MGLQTLLRLPQGPTRNSIVYSASRNKTGSGFNINQAMVEVEFHHLHILLFSAMELTKTLSDHVQRDDLGQEP